MPSGVLIAVVRERISSKKKYFWLNLSNFSFFYLAVNPCLLLFIPIDSILYLFVSATLIFIGWDLLFEWLWEVREKLLLTEYLVLIATFVAIHIIGIDAGILFGVVVAIIDHVVTTAQVTTVTRVVKRSRAVWKPGKFGPPQAVSTELEKD